MARRGSRASAVTQEDVLTPAREDCPVCGQRMWIAYHEHRRVVRLDGVWGLTLRVRRCHNSDCAAYHQAYAPEEAGTWALPQAEFGLDVIALVGQLRYREQRSVPQIHQILRERGVEIAERSVTGLLHRYEELVALRLGDATRLRERLAAQGGVILAIDGLQPDVGHEVLWVLRDVRSGEVLLARSLLSASEGDLAPLLEEVRNALSASEAGSEASVTAASPAVPILGVVSDGQHSIRRAVARALPGIPHQLCQFHYLREAARPVFEADRHAKKELKKRVRGVRPIERELEGQSGAEAEAVRGYCLAIRSALTDDGRPPLAASGLKLKERLETIAASLERVEQGLEGRVARRAKRSVTHLNRHARKGAEETACSAAAAGRRRAGGDGRVVATDPGRLSLCASRGAPARQSRPVCGVRRAATVYGVAARTEWCAGYLRLTAHSRHPFPEGDGQLLAGPLPLLCGG